MRSPLFVGATNAQLGAWTRLYVAAAAVEQSGAIPACANYDDRRWLALAQVTRSEVEDAIVAGLAEWRDGDLVVIGYDQDGERKIQAARENGKKSPGRPRKPSAKPSGKPRENRSVLPGVTQEEPEPNPSAISGSGSGSVTTTDRQEITKSGETASPSSPSVLVFPCDGQVRAWGLTQEQIVEWSKAFPSLDVLTQCRAALAWVNAAPQRRKTAGGMTRFLVGWLTRTQERGAGRAPGPTGAAPRDVRVGYVPAEVKDRGPSGEVPL
jgi:hypothetical protein